MQGWVELCYVEPATCKSLVQRPTAESPRNTRSNLVGSRKNAPVSWWETKSSEADDLQIMLQLCTLK